MRKTTIYATVTSVILWAIGMILTPQLISIFVKEQEIIKESIRAFRIMIAVFPIISIYYVSIFYFQAVGKARYSVTVSILRQLIIMLPLSIILVKGFNMGAMEVWISFPISDIISAIVAGSLIKKEGSKLRIKVKKQKENKEKIKKYAIN